MTDVAGDCPNRDETIMRRCDVHVQELPRLFGIG
jgi:hypothetical protein